MGNQVTDARGRKFSKRVVDIRELNEQAKVIDDLKLDYFLPMLTNSALWNYFNTYTISPLFIVENWEPVKVPSTRRSSGTSSWSQWPSTTSGGTSERSCAAPA